MKSKQKIKEWMEKDKQGLSREVLALQEKLRSLRFLSASGKLKNTKEILGVKKDIARILTIHKSKPEK